MHFANIVDVVVVLKANLPEPIERGRGKRTSSNRRRTEILELMFKYCWSFRFLVHCHAKVIMFVADSFFLSRFYICNMCFCHSSEEMFVCDRMLPRLNQIFSNAFAIWRFPTAGLFSISHRTNPKEMAQTQQCVFQMCVCGWNAMASKITTVNRKSQQQLAQFVNISSEKSFQQSSCTCVCELNTPKIDWTCSNLIFGIRNRSRRAIPKIQYFSLYLDINNNPHGKHTLPQTPRYIQTLFRSLKSKKFCQLCWFAAGWLLCI